MAAPDESPAYDDLDGFAYSHIRRDDLSHISAFGGLPRNPYEGPLAFRPESLTGNYARVLRDLCSESWGGQPRHELVEANLDMNWWRPT